MATHGVVLVTGGSRGIGRATSERFLREGWRVAVNYRSDDAAAAELVAGYPEAARRYRCDVTDEPAVQAMVGEIERDLGPLEVVVNNAGRWRGAAVHELSSSDFLAVLNVTLVGAKNCVAAAFPFMAGRHYGHIINVSSAVGLIGWKGDAAYASAKAGLIGFTRAVAKELAPSGIRVNAVAPGFVETDMTSEVSPRQRAQLRHRTLLAGAGLPEDVASMIYAVAAEGSYMTGSVVTVDGGFVLGRDEPLWEPIRSAGAGMHNGAPAPLGAGPAAEQQNRTEGIS